jgi:hypothetical protein
LLFTPQALAATPERPILLQKSALAQKKRSHQRRTRQLQQRKTVRELCNGAHCDERGVEIILNVCAGEIRSLCVCDETARRACGSACVIFASHYALILMRDKLDFN